MIQKLKLKHENFNFGLCKHLTKVNFSMCMCSVFVSTKLFIYTFLLQSKISLTITDMVRWVDYFGSQTRIWYLHTFTGLLTSHIWQRICSDFKEGMHDAWIKILHAIKNNSFLFRLLLLVLKLSYIHVTIAEQFCLPQLQKHVKLHKQKITT